MTVLVRSTALIAALSLAACERAAEKAPSAPDRADARPVDVAYACEGGGSLTARYPDARTAIVTWEGQTFTMTLAESASGSRFVGAGREWWLKAYPDREEGTLSPSPTGAAAGGPPLAVCTKSADAAPETGPEFNPSIPPKETGAAPGPSTDMVEGVRTSAPPCRSGDLSLRRVSQDAGAGQRHATYALLNNSRAACSLKGYPTLAWYDADGKALPGVKVIQSEANMFETSGPPAEVTLLPGGRGIFHIAYSGLQQGSKACPASARLQATPPENSQILEVDDTIKPCGGQVRVGPVRTDSDRGAAADPGPNDL